MARDEELFGTDLVGGPGGRGGAVVEEVRIANFRIDAVIGNDGGDASAASAWPTNR